MTVGVSITPQELLQAVVAADGDLAICAERLQLQGHDLTEQDIITRVSNTDNTTLGEVLRTGAIIMLYSMLNKTSRALALKIDRIPTADLAKVHAAQMQALANLTSRPTEDAVEQPVSIEAVRQRMLDKIDQHEERERQTSDG